VRNNDLPTEPRLFPMIYTDSLFLFLFVALFSVNLGLQKLPTANEWIIIAFSGAVIASWGILNLVIFLLAVTANYAVALAMCDAGERMARKLLVAAIAGNVLFLGIFKYANFLAVNLEYASAVSVPRFPLGLPLAISFYTFHAISYLVDLRAGRIALTSFRKFLFYLIFFPHVIAGPIVRAWQLVPQIGVRRLTKYDLAFGVHYLVLGYFLKAIGADNIAESIDAFWASGPSPDLTMADRWVLAFLYYCQIYSDFAGYSLMALGMARLLGYKLPANFRSPMRSTTLQEFWRRWHITLSRWLRDYLYIPLGGSRDTAMRTAYNLLVTMVLGGLWHGAGWGFVIWGAMHGTWIALERTLGMNRPKRRWPLSIFSWFITQAWVTLAFVFFRSPDLDFAIVFVSGMLNFVSANGWYLHNRIGWVLIFALPAVLHHFAPSLLGRAPSLRFAMSLGVSTGMLLIATLVLLPPAGHPFIYFRF
jgi:alginate O-acetyltransferase complex protein AlgI